MKRASNRIRVWTEQRNVTVPQLFFQFYKQLGITDEEAILMMHLLSFHEEGNDFPTPIDLQKRTHYPQNTISTTLQRLMQKGFLELTQDVDAAGKLFEKFSMYPLWERILDQIEMAEMAQTQQQQQVDEKSLFPMFEQELGRLLSPMEIETIGMWLDADRHSPELIKAALKEAVLAGKVSLRYIDRILFEWKKKNITSMEQVEKHAEQYRKSAAPIARPAQSTESPQHKPATVFYNWLEERE